MIGYHTAVDNAADDIALIHLFHLHLNQAVVDQYAHTHLKILIETVISYAHLILRALYLIGSQGKELSLLQSSLSLLKVLDTDLRPFGIEQDRYRHAHFLPKFFHQIHSPLMILVNAVGKVTPGNVHPF